MIPNKDFRGSKSFELHRLMSSAASFMQWNDPWMAVDGVPATLCLVHRVTEKMTHCTDNSIEDKAMGLKRSTRQDPAECADDFAIRIQLLGCVQTPWSPCGTGMNRNQGQMLESIKRWWWNIATLWVSAASLQHLVSEEGVRGWHPIHCH